MKHHRATWRVERAGWVVISLLLISTVLGAFGDGPLSHGRSGSEGATVEYARLLRASAPTEYRFLIKTSLASNGVIQVRIDNSLMDLMQIESIVPAPHRQTAGPNYTEFAFLVTQETSRARVVFNLRPVTFGRYGGHVSVPGAPPLRVDHFVYP